jgi:hypothetical protein
MAKTANRSRRLMTSGDNDWITAPRGRSVEDTRDAEVVHRLLASIAILAQRIESGIATAADRARESGESK